KITVECVWMHILGLLMVKPRYGYSLREEIKKEFGFNIGRITAYKVLYNLKRRGYVRVVQRKRKSQRGPERKYYEITENGKELLMGAGQVMNEFTCHFTGM
ncbi:MAG: PadR family transcriptional regulator, partial [Candidatus Aenigmarchaeota archaeon]|nr:PadR family transcriptional regulator [Candidatus Aenigmarchaeota archaeon]